MLVAWSTSAPSLTFAADPVGAWQPTGSMATGAYEHDLIVLPFDVARGWRRHGDGRNRVRRAGVSDATGDRRDLRSRDDGYHLFDGYTAAEVYDPATKRWSPAGDMAFDRYDHGAVLLPSGQVLVSGGWNTSTCNAGEPQLATCTIVEAELFTVAPTP